MENEDSRRVAAIAPRRRMARSSALTLLAFALCAQPCTGAALSKDNELHSLRGHQLRHLHPDRVVSDVQLPTGSWDDLHPRQAEEVSDGSDDNEESDPTEETQAENAAPLYDDFLDVMNHAAAQALKQQRAVPAYDDFLNLMKGSADKAYKEQADAPSYDDFLTGLKGKADLASNQQVKLPSYDDFLSALKDSSVEALKTPVPTYEDFLTVLKKGAEGAMHKRQMNDDSVQGEVAELKTLKFAAAPLAAEVAAKNEHIIQTQNPLDRFRKHAEKARAKVESQVNGEKHSDEHKLRRELEDLQAKKKNHKGDVAKRPIMKRINVLRTQLCWKRPNLWKHEKCLRFLGLHCMQESTGEGICKAFAKQAKAKCQSSNDANWKADYCALDEALSDEILGDDSEDVDEEENAEEEELEQEDAQGQDGKTLTKEVDEHGHEIGSDEDLDEEEKEVSDRDGDGVPDSEDAFADDPSEWKDTDKDGIGDNSDKDLDGDGINNDVDAFPSDPKEWKDTDLDGIGDNADKDRDNDGVENDKDKFPDDPTEWLDSDGDGVGDNKDSFPFNPNCHDPLEPCTDLSKHAMPKPGSAADPGTLDMDAKRLLPPQGYNEHGGPNVAHRNYYTYSGDWQEEFPLMMDSESDTMASICKDHPENQWCTKFKGRDAHFR